MTTIPTDFSDPKLREACDERCAGFGDPGCYTLAGTGPITRPFQPKPCAECLRDIGIEPGDEFDETAAMGRML